jgi:hypothetical protein
MIDFKLNPIFHKIDAITNVLYHGSPIMIDDMHMAAGTFFTIDKDIARDYGRFIYSFEIDEGTASIFYPDIFREHLISSCIIPMYMFNIEECSE